MLKQTHSDATVTAATDARALRLVAESIGVVPSSFCQCLTLRPVQAVHTKIYPKNVPIFSCTLSHPVSPGKLLMLSGVFLIQRFTSTFLQCLDVGYIVWDALEDMVTTTWPRLQLCLPNKLKLCYLKY